MDASIGNRSFQTRAGGREPPIDFRLSDHNTLQTINHSDDSTVRERMSGSGTDQVFWFDPNDAQALTTELIGKQLPEIRK